MSEAHEWPRFREWCLVEPGCGITLDLSRMGMPDPLGGLGERLHGALAAMSDLERGVVANPDEGRQVGHYWLRAPERAPEPGIRAALERDLEAVLEFAGRVRDGEVRNEQGETFTRLLCVGIGGSALGPQLLIDALAEPGEPLRPSFLDNTDPDGMERVFAELGGELARTLVVVISKSGGTPETRNGMVEVREALRRRGLQLAPRAVAITGEGSRLDAVAVEEGWVARFPMYDFVGGRTSLFGPVGLLPAAIGGLDVRGLLAGARRMDEATRQDPARNPAAWLAAAWHHATEGKGRKDMVVLPYKDRLLLFSRYLQQLIMESLGKEFDLDGRVVEQGISVYGNKGSTDQHAYVQQLRDGVPNFFVSFLQILRDREGESCAVDEAGMESGDYLLGFLLGTRAALAEKGRPSLTICADRLDAPTLGALIALFERTVGFYATLINVNAYHQPGVEAGKKAARGILDLQARVMGVLNPDPAPVEEVARRAEGDPETVWHLLRHLEATREDVRREGADLFAARWARG